MSWMSGDADKNIGEPGLRIDAVHFGCDEGWHRRSEIRYRCPTGA
jgi:hypothetical protein